MFTISEIKLTASNYIVGISNIDKFFKSKFPKRLEITKIVVDLKLEGFVYSYFWAKPYKTLI